MVSLGHRAFFANTPDENRRLWLEFVSDGLDLALVVG